MRFVCESCRAQYMINDDKVGPKGVKVRCRKCGYVILVKRTDAAKSGNGPVALSNDPDDAMATQVMQTPLGGPETTLANDSTTPEAPSPAAARTQTSGLSLEAVEDKEARAAVKASFLGADEDEIGAVFDQVLKTGPTSLPKEGPPERSDDDRESTRIIDAEMVKKLAEASSGKQDEAATVEKKVEAVPETDWYVAIDDKQTGPLTLEALKELWDKGEIGPDSLCWRAGFDDWIPVSEAKMLASVLAPQPPKPIVVAPAPVAAPAVVSVPVQSAFSAGGVMQTVQSEVQVPMGMAAVADSAEDTSTWKPTAASALASLVNEELAALARPAPKAAPPLADDVPMSRGLLDLPAAEEKAGNGGQAPAPEAARPQPVAAPPVNPYLANPGATFSAPAVTQYRPPSNRNLLIAIGAGGGLILIVLIVLVVWLATRPPQVVVTPPPQPGQSIALAQPPMPPTQPPPLQPTPPTQLPPSVQPTPPAQPPAIQPTSSGQPTAVQPTPPAPPPPVQPTQPSVTEKAPESSAELAKKDSTATPKAPRSTSSRTTKVEPPEPKAPPPPRETKLAAADTSGGDDDFAKAFGVPTDPAPRQEARADSGGSKKGAVYIPPAPGSTAVKESLGQSDIMEVVLASKSALAKCAEVQRQKDPGTSGKLVMRWTILTSGRTSNVQVVSEEFKGTYMASCVGSVIKGWQFPRHKQQGEPITFPFKF